MSNALIHAGLLVIVQGFIAKIGDTGVEATENDHVVDFVRDFLYRSRKLNWSRWGIRTAVSLGSWCLTEKVHYFNII